MVPLLVFVGACKTSTPATEEIPPTVPITIAVAGDTLLTRPVDPRDAGIAGVRDLMRGAALAFVNLNVNILEETPPAAAPEQASWPFARPRDAAALRDLGVGVVSLANDHAADYGAAGLAATRRALARAGLLDVGAGPDLAAARRPVLIGRSADGRARVAIVALATSSASGSRATASRADIGRPGLNPLRYAADITADPKTFQTLAEKAAAAGGSPGTRQAAETISLFGTTIRRGERTAIQFLVDSRDEREILDTIAAAHRDAEFVIVSLHSHEPANASAEPADFVRLFARRAIDAGAHAVVGHGPHRLRGVEAYRGGLILYSVGDFVSQAADVAPGGANAFDAGADLNALTLGGAAAPRPAAPSSETASLAVLLDFFEGTLARARLEPLELGREGTPIVAGPEKRAEILETLRRLSAPGTRIRADGAVAEVALH